MSDDSTQLIVATVLTSSSRCKNTHKDYTLKVHIRVLYSVSRDNKGNERRRERETERVVVLTILEIRSHVQVIQRECNMATDLG